jgi:hypothetical protein
MRQTGTYRLAAQHGNFGYFAEVSINVTMEPGEAGLRVEFADDTAESWRSGARFGIAYTFEKSPMLRGRGNRVVARVTGIRGHPVDTTEVLVAYVSAAAFWQAVGITPSETPIFDHTAATVTFPK